MDNLALAYHQAGRLADALALGEATAGAAERCLGAEHPYAARAKRNLRDFRDSASDAER